MGYITNTAELTTLVDLVEELVELKIELRRWEDNLSPRSDEKIAEIKGQITAVKAAINAAQNPPVTEQGADRNKGQADG